MSEITSGRTSGRTSMAGQTLVMFAVVLAFMLIGMLGLIADLGAVFTAYTQADDVALLATQAGASAIDTQEFYNGRIVLDAAGARDRCKQVLASASYGGPSDCTIKGGSVQADVQTAVHLPLPIWGVTVPIHVSRQAHGVYGDVTGKRTT
jgi:Flp pilus assembly protein TadG